MATKATGSGRAPSLEAWNPNIKAPGIQQRAGAYYSGKVYETPDYAEVNEAVQESWQKAAKSGGEATGIFMEKTDISGSEFSGIIMGAESEKDRAKAARDEWKNMSDEEKAKYDKKFDAFNIRSKRAYVNARKKNEIDSSGNVMLPNGPDSDILNDSANADQNNKSTDDTENSLYTSGVDAFDSAAKNLLPEGKGWTDLKRREKIAIKDKLGKLSTLKQNLGKFWEGWKGHDVANLDFNAFNDHPDAKEFVRHLLTEGDDKGKFQILYSEKGGPTPTIAFTDRNGVKRTLSGGQLEAAISMWNDNSEMKKTTNSLIGAYGDKLMQEKKDWDANITQREMAGEVSQFAMDNRIQTIVEGEDMRANYSFIFGNMMKESHGDETRYVKYKGANGTITVPNPNHNPDVDGSEPTMEITHEQAVQEYLTKRMQTHVGIQQEVKPKPITNNKNQDTRTKEQIELDNKLAGYGLGRDDIAGGTGEAFQRVMRLGGIDYRETGIAAGTKPSEVVENKDLFPDFSKNYENDKFYQSLNTAWNSESNGELVWAVEKSDLEEDKLKQIVQFGLVNNGDFSKFGGNNDHAENVWKVWSEKHGNKVIVGEGTFMVDNPNFDSDKAEGPDNPKKIKRNAPSVGGKETTEDDINNLLAFGNNIVNKKTILGPETGKGPEIKIVDGKRILTLYYKTGSEKGGTQKVDKMTYNLSLEEERKQLFRHILGIEDDSDKTGKYNDIFRFYSNELKNK